VIGGVLAATVELAGPWLLVVPLGMIVGGAIGARWCIRRVDSTAPPPRSPGVDLGA
jgi:hypothetical protein